MPKVHIDHIALCVRDLEVAVQNWTDILSVLAPGFLNNITRGEGESDGTKMVWATLQNPDPTGVSIQLWAPSDESSWVHRMLEKRGEFVHHIAFLSDDFDTTMQEVRTAGLPVLLDEDSSPDTMPFVKWNFIPESKTNGVLIELATRYQAGEGIWLPHPGNAEQRDLSQRLHDEHYAVPTTAE
jgi:methylmalonyl-CoA/ethylmalonyl-CoA epimerase